jgi:hypothetical protein
MDGWMDSRDSLVQRRTKRILREITLEIVWLVTDADENGRDGAFCSSVHLRPSHHARMLSIQA